MFDIVSELVQSSGIAAMSYKELIMIVVALFFLYLAIRKGYEPYLLIPIAFGMLLANLPLAGMMAEPTDGQPGGFLYYLNQGIDLGIYPPLIFICLGASTDFGPLLANPKTLLIGGAAQFGIFSALFLAIVLGMSPQEASAIGIIGGADGPTAIYLTTHLALHLLPVIALAAYSYMALVPIIQPPIMRLLTTEEERSCEMKQLRKVTKKEKILFPIVTTLFVCLLIPSATTLIGTLMLGNLIRESGIVPKLSDTLQNAFMNTITVILALSVGAKATGDTFLTWTTISIIVLGLIAFAVGTASGVFIGKLMFKWTNGQINPLIGAAGVSAIPMSARVVQKEGVKANANNYLLMHAMGPNVAGIVGSAVTAGVLLSFFG